MYAIRSYYEISPYSNAVCAESLSPNIHNSFALAIPTSCGKKKEFPLSGTNPILQKACINETFSFAITKSQASYNFV